MTRHKSKVQDWLRTVVSTVLAILIVGACLGGILYMTPTPMARNDLAGKSNPLKSLASSTTSEKSDQVSRTGKSNRDRARPEQHRRTDDQGTDKLAVASSVSRPESRGTDGRADQWIALTPSKPDATRDSKTAEASTKPIAANRKKSEALWEKDLRHLHNLVCKPKRGSVATKREIVQQAQAELDAIDDPKAVAPIWNVFARSPSHQHLVAQMLGRIDTPVSTRKLAELAVFSEDEKARWQATNALRTRNPSDFVEPLTSVFNTVRYQRDHIDYPGQGRGQVIVIEEDRALYQLVYPPPAKAAPPRNSGGVYSLDNQYMTPEKSREAVRSNQAQEEQARISTDEQIKMDVASIERFSQLCRDRNDRVIRVLRNATQQYNLPPDREAWKQWLTERKGQTYVRPPDRPKEQFVNLMPALYQPTYISIPEPT